MRIVCILQSEASYKRIKEEIKNKRVQFIYENDIEHLRFSLITNDYDLAIVDVHIPQHEEFIQILDKKNIKITNFRGQYDQLFSVLNIIIDEILEKEIQEEEFSTEPSIENKISIQKVVKTERIEVPVYQNVANKLISVVNLSERAGSTFIATNLARSVAKRNIPVNLFENPIGTVDLYYSLGLLFEEERFYSYRKALKEDGRIDKNELPNFEGVKIAAIEPDYNNSQWNLTDTLRLFSSYSGINIVDIGWNFDEPRIKEILNMSSIILVVMEPNPTQILRNNDRLSAFEDLKSDGLNVKYVFNKWHDVIKKKKFIEGIEIVPYLIIPAIDSEIVYSSLFKTKFEYFVDIPNVSEELEYSLEPIMREHFPIIESDAHKRKRFSLFKR